MDIKEKKDIKNILKGLKDLHGICLKKNIPFVSFHSPGKTCIKTLLQTISYPRKLSSLTDINRKRGFIISPFRKTLENYSFFLEPDIEIENDDFNETLLDQLEKNKTFNNAGYPNGKDLFSITKEKFIEQIQYLQDEIKKGKIKKAVLSRIHFEKRSENFNVTDLLIELTIKYPDAFVYLFCIPEAGCWIGATPEPLILINNNLFETISLAGTQKSVNSDINKVNWAQKEVEEQDIVTKYIDEILINFNIKNYNKIGPFTYKAGNVMHLKTRFTFNVELIKNKIGEFAEALHPTPSVCGLPKDDAYELIENTEIHHREYYTGLLGPVNINNETSLYVNLRCMKLLKDKMALFLGAGITSASVPEDEWDETEQKKMTLLSAIQMLNK